MYYAPACSRCGGPIATKSSYIINYFKVNYIGSNPVLKYFLINPIIQIPNTLQDAIPNCHSLRVYSIKLRRLPHSRAFGSNKLLEMIHGGYKKPVQQFVLILERSITPRVSERNKGIQVCIKLMILKH